MRHPVRIKYKDSRQYPVPESQKKKWGRTKLLIDCELCKAPIPKSRAEVDHKVEAGSLKTLEDVLQFIYRLLFVTWDDIRCLCKDCHAITTYATRHGISFQEAKIEKEVVAFGKLPAHQQEVKLVLLFGGPIGKTNAKQRKEYYRKYLKENNV